MRYFSVWGRVSYVFLISFLLFLYFSNNIKAYDQGSLYIILLGIITIFSLIIFFIELMFYYDVRIKKSFFILGLFLIYMVIKIINDTGELYILKVFTISTTGGIILFYGLGVIVSSLFIFLKEQVMNNLKIVNIMYLISFGLFFLIFLDIYLHFILPFKDNLFFLAHQGIEHQRAGTFLVISFMILTFLYNYFIIINNKRQKLILIFLISFIYFVSIFGAIILSQMMGSNNAFVNLCLMLFLSLTFVVSIYYFKIHEQIVSIKLSFKNIFFSKLTLNFVLSLIYSLGFVLIVFFLLLVYLDIDTSQFRIFGFGSGKISSIISRLSLWDNFFIHFFHDPIFGNVNIDKNTTGEGTYVHSFVGSLLTHFGLVGFILFLSYLYFAFKELIYDDNLVTTKLILIFNTLLFSGIFLIANLAVFMSWIPLWFLLGLIFPPILLKKKKCD